MSMLTTADNPFDPYSEFDQWYVWDISHGYNTCGYLARVSFPSDALSDQANHDEIERAIDEIVRVNINGLYLKVEPGEILKLREKSTENSQI